MPTTDALAGGALLLDPTKLRSEAWRITFAAVLAGVVVAFVASRMRALGASSRTLPWAYPAFEDIFGRAESDVAAAQAARAASLLKTPELNSRIVELKAGYLNAACGDSGSRSCFFSPWRFCSSPRRPRLRKRP
jgi:hypothetical protein